MNPVFGISIWLLIKIAALILLGLYIVFALVIIRQIKVMTDTIRLGFESPVKFLSYIHLIFAAFVFLTALIIL